MNKKKTIITAVVLLAVLVVGGLLAYFQDTDTKTNVFTLGNVHIQLNETGWELVSGENYKRTAENNYNITPNQTIAKAPTVTNIGNGTNGNDAYVFLKVEVPYASISVDGATASAQDVYTYNNYNVGSGNDWQEVSSTVSGSKKTYVFVLGSGTAQNTMTKLGYNVTTDAIFESVTLKNIEDPATLPNDLNIKITAYGIQTEDLDLTSATGTTDAAKIFSLFN